MSIFSNKSLLNFTKMATRSSYPGRFKDHYNCGATCINPHKYNLLPKTKCIPMLEYEVSHAYFLSCHQIDRYIPRRKPEMLKFAPRSTTYLDPNYICWILGGNTKAPLGLECIR